jgi:uncharacterized protein YndB with AHSA1/START domain
MIDIVRQLAAIHRAVGKQPADNGDDVTVLLRRDYTAEIEDVWDAVTDPERVRRWFVPLTGDLRPGGKFQLEGNAGGEILTCEPPRLLKVTFGGPDSLVELRLAAAGDTTTLELKHTVPLSMAGSGAGALFVGPGWDGALLSIDLFVRGEISPDPIAAAKSLEVQEFSRQSAHAWAAAVESSDTATAEEIAAATEMSLAQFAPDVTEG